MFAGIDFPSYFEDDNFSQRRAATASAGVAHDPESMISGGELASGLTFQNSKRNWKSESEYLVAVSGELTPADILQIAPRVLIEPEKETSVFIGRDWDLDMAENVIKYILPFQVLVPTLKYDVEYGSLGNFVGFKVWRGEP